MKSIITVIAFLMPLGAATLPENSQLEVRILHKVGSRGSRVGEGVRATVITPVFAGSDVVIPAGATVCGVIDRIDKLGLGLGHTAARLDLHFTLLELPDGASVSIDARVASVEEAREVVNEDGAIIGIHPSASFSTGVSGAFTLFSFGQPELRLPVLAFKFLAARSPDAEITFPAGTEMVLRLARELELQPVPSSEAGLPLLTRPQGAHVQNALAILPQQQARRDDKYPSDLINIALIGSQDAVERAFRAAGWNGTETHGVMALYHMYHCVVQRVGYSRAPMTDLKFNGNSPDAAFQKNLNTFAKRHHIRLWHDRDSGLWLGAATEDVKYTMRRMRVSHGTDRYVDNERAKVVNDLAFTGCIDQGALVPRAFLKKPAPSIVTDGDVAVLQLNVCESPNVMPADPQTPRPVRAIRAAIAVSEDIVRSNPVSVTYAMIRSMFERSQRRANRHKRDSDTTYTRAAAISRIGEEHPGSILALR